MSGSRERVREEGPPEADLQVEITRLAFLNSTHTAVVGAVGVSGTTAAVARAFHDPWLWNLAAVMAFTGAVRIALSIAFERRKDRVLTPIAAKRWLFAYAGVTAWNCCNLAISTLYNFSHHDHAAQFICTMGVFILCVAIGASFGMRPWMAQGCGLIILGSLAYPIFRSPDPLLAWDGCAAIALFTLVFLKLVAGKYEMVVDQLRLKRTMSHLAEHDALTGLANRRQFEASLELACRQPAPFAVFFLDLDGFKSINDTHGHATGDMLLQHVSGRLKNIVQPTDVVSRLGGDEFAILHRPATTRATTEVLAGKILETVSAPYSIDNQTIRIGTSIGIQLSLPGRNDPRRLLSQADAALYDVKQSGKGNFRFVESSVAVILAGPKAASPDAAHRSSGTGQNTPHGVGKLLVGIGE